MEINHYTIIRDGVKVFKIDLIVWKYIYVIINLPHFLQFKIDLIVWKSSIVNTSSDTEIPFKIDLIVWKFARIRAYKER